MEYTFGQAKTILSDSAYLHGGGDIGDHINAAVAALAGLSGWNFLRRLVRTFSDRPVFALPQGASELVRVCVNGKPASLHPTDYQFLHSGPGDLDRFRARGFRLLPSSDVADLGTSPLLFQPPEPVFVAATSSNPGTNQKVTVSGTLVTGEKATVKVVVVAGEPGEYPAYASFDTSAAFASVDSVVLDAGASAYVSLFGMTLHGSYMLLGHYHPSFRVPKFRVYEISGCGRPPYDILAEVRIAPLPCVDDDDIIQLPSLEPIKHMLLYTSNLAMNEGKTAQDHLQQAMQWLQQMEVADNTIQAPVVQNVLYEGSAGELSELDNL